LREYLAPEQIRGEAIAESTDIYTFGLLVYEMLDGTPPFTGASLPLGRRGRKVPNSIDRLVLQALEKAPDRRPPDMTEVANTLWTELGRLDERILKSKRRRPAWKVAGAGSLAVLVAAAWVLISQKAHPPATVTPRSPAVMSAPAVIPPTEQDLPEERAAADGVTEAAPVPTASPNAASVEPAAPEAVEHVPAGSAAPPAKPEVGSRLTKSRPSGDQGRRKQARPAGQDIMNSDEWTMRAPAMSPGKERSSDRYESRPPVNTDTNPPTLPRTPDAPDPSEVIDWLLQQSSAAR
jgi:serine/threonine protein kinase